MTVETIPLPRERITNHQPFQVRVSDLAAWPDQEIVCYFEYNDIMGKWVWEMETAAEGSVIPRSKAVLGRRYSCYPYMVAVFRDPHESADRITSNNLGDQVVLTVLPGPLGGTFPDSADLSQEEEDELLKRHWYDPVR